jgi:hypothetical protein
MSALPDKSRVLVPIANPANVPALMELAACISGPDGAVTATYVLTSEPRPPQGRHDSGGTDPDDLLALARREGERRGVTVATELVFADDVPAGVTAATRKHQTDLLLAGWRGGVAQRWMQPVDLTRVLRGVPCSWAVLLPRHPEPAIQPLSLLTDTTSSGDLARVIGARLTRAGAPAPTVKALCAGANGEKLIGQLREMERQTGLAIIALPDVALAERLIGDPKIRRLLPRLGQSLLAVHAR